MKQYGHFILFMWLPLVLFIYLIPAHSFMIPRLSPIRGKILVETNTNDHVKTFYYQQTLDHFNFFPQRYFINFKYWGGANSTAPIFVTFGGEEELDPNSFVGFVEENAPAFKALLVYIEVKFCR
jgi:lysosomal Pro-X carboxypeptidase